MKKFISIFLISCLLLSVFVGCSNKKNEIVGKWYNSSDKCLDIRSDGTWKLEDSYGTGTYKLLDDKETFEFTDYYGDTQESKIISGDMGLYIDFGSYGDFYKEHYPKISELKETDIFKDIKLVYEGASPFLKVGVDDSSCSKYIKDNITFHVNYNWYKLGDDVIVTATTKGSSIYDDALTKTLQVKNAPKYVETVDEIDKEKMQKITSQYLDEQLKKHKNGSCESNDLYYRLHSSNEVVSVEVIESGIFKVKDDVIEKERKDTTHFITCNAYYELYAIKIRNTQSNKTQKIIGEVLYTNIAKKTNGEYAWNVKVQTGNVENVAKAGVYLYLSDFKKSYYSSYCKDDNVEVSAIYTQPNFDINSFY